MLPSDCPQSDWNKPHLDIYSLTLFRYFLFIILMTVTPPTKDFATHGLGGFGATEGECLFYDEDRNMGII